MKLASDACRDSVSAIAGEFVETIYSKSMGRIPRRTVRISLQCYAIKR